MTVDLEPNEWQQLLQAAGNGGTYNQLVGLMQKVMGQLNAAATAQAGDEALARKITEEAAAVRARKRNGRATETATTEG